MSSRRMSKVAEGVRQVVSSVILFELRDPRVTGVTVLGVDVAPDLRTAKVRVSTMGDDKQQRLALKGLTSARGFIQARIAEQLDLRYTPILTFVQDDGVKKSIAVSMMLRDMEAERQSEELSEEDELPTASDAGDATAMEDQAPDRGSSDEPSSDEADGLSPAAGG